MGGEKNLQEEEKNNTGLRNLNFHWVQWYVPVIPACGRLRQQDHKRSSPAWAIEWDPISLRKKKGNLSFQLV
jgi:hypothetical protein